MAKKNSIRSGKVMERVTEAVVIKPVEGEVIPLPRISKQEEKFVGHYAVFANGAAAVRFAGYEVSEMSVYQQSFRLLRKSDIQAHITAARDKLGDLNFDVSNRIMQKLDAMMEADITEAFDAQGGITDPASWPEGLKMLLLGIEVEETLTGEGDNTGLLRTKKVKFDSRRSVMETMAKIVGALKGGSGDGDGEGGPVNNFNVQVNCIVGGAAVKS
jgi:phage terminase small subunit